MGMMQTRGLYPDEFEALRIVLEYLGDEIKDYEGQEGREGHIYESTRMLSEFLFIEDRILQAAAKYGCWSFVKEHWRAFLAAIVYVWAGFFFVSELIRISVKHYCTS